MKGDIEGKLEKKRGFLFGISREVIIIV